MTAQFTTDPTDQFHETSFNVKKQWRLVPSRRIALTAVGALAVGMVASAYQVLNSPEAEPEAVARPAVVSAQADISAISDAPAVPVVQAPSPAKAAESRVGRVEPASVAEESQARAQAKVAALRDDDPRWGRAATSGEAATPEPIETAELRAKLERLQDPAPAGQAEVAAARNGPEPTDANPTGAIPARADSRSAPALEAAPPAAAAAVRASAADDRIADEPAPAIAAVSAVPEDSAPVAAKEADKPAASTRSAKVTTHVNMRAGPENEAAVLTVVPAGRNVQVIGCDMWCEITFDGRRGWVFKSFIAGS